MCSHASISIHTRALLYSYNIIIILVCPLIILSYNNNDIMYTINSTTCILYCSTLSFMHLPVQLYTFDNSNNCLPLSLYGIRVPYYSVPGKRPLPGKRTCVTAWLARVRRLLFRLLHLRSTATHYIIAYSTYVHYNSIIQSKFTVQS